MAFEEVPRHHFLPDRIRPVQARDWVDRVRAPEEWLSLAYSDQPVVTQVDDGADDGPGVPSSSSSKPSVMAKMLMAAAVKPGDRVLEIGTGTGYNAALLAELVGSHGSVTTVEVDEDLSRQAQAALADAGYRVKFVVGEGAAGWPSGAPFDAVIATCAVTRVPGAWLSQTRPGGVVVTPWKPNAALPGGLLARLEAADGQSQGRFAGGTSFMLLRSQRWNGGAAYDPAASPDVTRSLDSDPREVVLDQTCGPQLAMMVPSWRWGAAWPDGPRGDHVVWLTALNCSAWARLYPDGRVEQGGQRRLWDEIEAAHTFWFEHGRPPITDFGLTVTREGEHRVWLEEPGGPVWIQGT
ncbi:methyltransferase domain-containing protein [Marinactinospora rubrisoli]|uniref:Protein-L-isoaspartate O-methyltransferase n=1 Tax=Marinactinospora rubrisoli TaxID=2715399 RepID=A0ABW2KQD8_9ACTN